MTLSYREFLRTLAERVYPALPPFLKRELAEGADPDLDAAWLSRKHAIWFSG
jgi:hypothetical protein